MCHGTLAHLCMRTYTTNRYYIFNNKYDIFFNSWACSVYNQATVSHVSETSSYENSQDGQSLACRQRWHEWLRFKPLVSGEMVLLGSRLFWQQEVTEADWLSYLGGTTAYPKVSVQWNQYSSSCLSSVYSTPSCPTESSLAQQSWWARELGGAIHLCLPSTGLQAPTFLSVAVLKDQVKSTGERKGLFDLQVTVHHQRKPKQEAGGRNWNRGHEKCWRMS